VASNYEFIVSGIRYLFKFFSNFKYWVVLLFRKKALSRLKFFTKVLKTWSGRILITGVSLSNMCKDWGML